MSKCSRVCGITALVGGDDEHDEIDAADAGEHGPHEPLVTGHVHERDPRLVDPGMGEAQLDGDAARLFLLEPIGIDAGQRLDEGALAVVDVAGGADDEVTSSLLALVRSRSAGPLLAGVRRGRPGLHAVRSGAPLRGSLLRAGRQAALRGRGRRSVRRARASSTSSTARSICRRSRSTRTTCTRTRSPSR